MNDYNKIIITGRITQTPKLYQTHQGKPVTTLCLASTRKYRTKTGEMKKEVCFINAKVWGPFAETCTKYLTKGQRVLVEGILTQQVLKTEKEKKYKIYEIRTNQIIFIEKPIKPSKESQQQDKESQTSN